jgi:predicted nucleic acid-binding protein
MKRVFVDANVFLRFFRKDSEEQRIRASRLFHQAAAGEILLVTGPPVLFEIAWTLRSLYKLTKEECLDVLNRILAFPGLEIIGRSLAEAALQLATESNQEFADSYIAASMQPSDCEAIATFNRKHFERLGVTVHEF